MKKITMLFLCLGISLMVFAQAPYKHSVGVYFGSFNGITYKAFNSGSTGFQVDAGLKLNFPRVDNHTVMAYSVEVNPNVFRQMSIPQVNGLYWLLGGGAGIGAAFHPNYSWFKLGVNAIGGIEYKFNIPLALQLDLRPGLGFMIGNPTRLYFDWTLSFSARYVIR